MKHTDYDQLAAQVKSLTEDVPHRTANFANISALLFDTMDGINWAGFYFLEGDRLVLGPFQGKPACIEIPVGKGVCGTAVQENRTQVVTDVHAFPGHIASDSAARSEIVIPLHKDGAVAGVLDIDSPLLARFTETDRDGLEKISSVIESMDWFSY